MPVWDTSVVARLRPGGQLEDALVLRAQTGAPVAIAEPTVMEVVHGLQVAAARDGSSLGAALGWFVDLVCGELVEVLPLDREAAVVAGRLRALHPGPPPAAGHPRGRTRAGWRLDEQIAACAWVHGRTLATDNERDFRLLGELIAGLYPGTTPLVVEGARELTA
jgi:predicted nucleic acid-binding protein